jgi:ferritin
MDLREYTTEELVQSLVAESAKALSEVRTIQSDLDKVNSRLRFILTVNNILKERKD